MTDKSINGFQIDISFGIVTHNSKDDILSLLTSLKTCGLEEKKIFIVDNASSDDTLDLIKDNCKNFNLTEFKQNIGFGAAHNIIIKNVGSKYHFIVNPDIILEKDQLEGMVSYMENHPDVCILSPKILNIDGSEQFLPKKNPSFRYLFGGRLSSKIRDEYTMKNELTDKPQEVDFCTGCFMMCRTDALKACDGFDERYFLYLEDCDLTMKMKKYGKTMYVPSFTVVHSWKRNSSKSIIALFQHVYSACKYLKKWK